MIDATDDDSGFCAFIDATPENNKLETSHVYLAHQIKNNQNGPVKVGSSSNLRRRLKALQTGNPDKLMIEDAAGPFTKNRAKEIEDYLHKALGHDPEKWCVGEWFKWSVADAKHAVRSAERYFQNPSEFPGPELFHLACQERTILNSPRHKTQAAHRARANRK